MKLGRLGLLSLPLVLALTACPGPIGPGPDGEPVINDFSATPSAIDTPGEEVTLTWDVENATSISISPDVGTVTGTETTVTPQMTTTYTLTASGPGGSDNATTVVTVGTDQTAPGGGDDGTPPTGTFGVSGDADGDFINDMDGNITDPSDERIVTVEAGGTFYAQVAYSDPAGITDIEINLVNSSPEGLAGTLSTDAPVGGFTLAGEPTGDCDLASSPTTVTCVYAINVAEDVDNIDQLPGSGNEFAYVFRTKVTDASGNQSNEAIRGYVIIE